MQVSSCQNEIARWIDAREDRAEMKRGVEGREGRLTEGRMENIGNSICPNGHGIRCIQKGLSLQSILKGIWKKEGKGITNSLSSQ